VAFNTLGSNRETLDGLSDESRQQLIDRDVLVGDPRRWRPRWFDGRFLAASDLQGEQNYFLVRQADLARAGGTGVVDGLMASQITDTPNGGIRIDPGQGVTDTGELIVLFDPLTVNPADVPEMQRLDAAFGLQVIPTEPGRSRTGLYVLALRAVEWTANPIGAYPTSLTGPRTVEDSTIVEGVAVSLISYSQQTADDTGNRRRARAAREIFVDGRNQGMTSGVLPIAMVSLRGNLVEWVDAYMVRRETGAERPAGMDFGFGARALREAHLLQYQQHLADALDDTPAQSFAAATMFDALPPVGQFPAATIDANALTHRFFPAGIEVELSFVPADEMTAIIEESLLVPPIDLTIGPDALTGTGVIALVPLSRADFATNVASLPNWDATLPRLRPAVTQNRALASPRDLLLSRVFGAAAPAPQPAQEEPWRQLLRNALNQQLLWYVRRRHLPIPANVAGTPVAADSGTVRDPFALMRVLDGDPSLKRGFDALRSLNAPEVNPLISRLSDRRFIDNPALLKSVVNNAAGDENAPSPDAAVRALAPVADPDLGKGLALLTASSAPLGKTLTSSRVVESGALAEIDRLARDVPADRVDDLAGELKTALKTGADVQANVTALRRRFVPTT
jgi:hypothetical protein